jgi:hypothetical protein
VVRSGYRPIRPPRTCLPGKCAPPRAVVSIARKVCSVQCWKLRRRAVARFEYHACASTLTVTETIVGIVSDSPILIIVHCALTASRPTWCLGVACSSNRLPRDVPPARPPAPTIMVIADAPLDEEQRARVERTVGAGLSKIGAEWDRGQVGSGSLVVAYVTAVDETALRTQLVRPAKWHSAWSVRIPTDYRRLSSEASLRAQNVPPGAQRAADNRIRYSIRRIDAPRRTRCGCCGNTSAIGWDHRVDR